MKDKFVYFGQVDVYDEKIFTKERAKEWERHLVMSYKDVYDVIKAKLDYDSPIQFFISKSLIKEVIIDAIIGMRKITNSTNNSVENPNAFKIVAYLSYWWLRHKPVSLHYPKNYGLEDVNILIENEEVDDEKREYERQKLVWQLKHINELVAVQIVMTYIFDFDNVLCDNRTCERIKRKENSHFCFTNFDEMRDIILRKLTYYFSYRALAPKMIEHLLEAYTFHPAWGLTGPQWNEIEEEVEEEK